MQDSLILQGEKNISAVRGAEISDQFKDYFTQDGSAIIGGIKYLPSRVAAELFDYAQDYIGQLCRSHKLDGMMIGRTWFVAESSLAAHKKEPKELIAQVSNDVYQTSSPLVLGPNSVVSRTGKGIVVNVAAGIIALVIVVSIVNIGRNIFYTPDPTVTAANAGGTWGAIASFFGNQYGNILSLFGGRNTLSMNVPPPTVTTEVDSGVTTSGDAGGAGMAVLPSSNNTKNDDTSKQKIRDSFSDEVNVAADQSGTAGVITPVFKNAADKKFLYVMVPVKKTSPP